MAKYQQLADKIIHDIQSGKLPAGEKMLSLRRFAGQHSISVSTAVSCYDELASRGWLVARPQAGFFIASPAREMSPPQWQPFISQLADPHAYLPKSHTPTGLTGISQLLIPESVSQQLTKCFRRALSQQAGRLSSYPQTQGEPEFLSALATHFSQSGFILTPDELVITHGCIDAVKTALEVSTRPGDAVAVNSPCFLGLLELLSQMERPIVEIPTTADGIDLDQFEQLLQAGTVKAGLFSTTFMNPQGITLSVAQKQRLAQLANHYRIPVIEDDVYLELSHQSGQPPLPAAYFDTQGYILWCGAITKSLSPAYRTGWCRPGRYIADYVKRCQGVPALMQHALAEFINSGHYARHLKQARTQLTLNMQHFLKYFDAQLPAGTRVTHPEGGLVLWLQIPGFDARKLAALAAQKDHYFITGPLFTTSDRYRDCLRVNIGYPLNEAVEKELAVLVELVWESLETVEVS
ncbi:putative HTH-type transcriptional regulator YjiR [Vibrio aerogenes CECT 7868]|uniref:Putative HTH-type transcriptional regulator YjiR n=1 Tax=Vibrio aerogenes CECT 7868 TaxID=1216006 RepID=A0A1M6EVX5_9VIBR|nr:PLP-dependent aminotransferase family protein [Vibrio aerogenes]SHI89541.1 putative HTH-type transcriptional regulator YjiR [Vibrio aerogenes CECT 7868]